jgi:hypothetical protein
MRCRLLALGSGIVIASVIALASSTLAGQAPSAQGRAAAPAGSSYVVTKTPDGHPDLQGTWDFRSGTPLERPKEFENKPFLTEQEIIEVEKKIAIDRNQDRRDQDARPKSAGEETTGDVARAYNDFWWDFGKKVTGSRRTSLIVDPPDGKIPALTDEGKRRNAVRTEMRARIPEWTVDRGVSERCVTGFNSGPPMNPSAYNNNMQLVQSKDHVAIVNEMVHNARIIHLDGRQVPNIRQYVGHSVGRWEGNTLVVETKNFYGEDNISLQNQGPNLQLTERFTRIAPDVLKYEYTVNDLTTWTKPWTAEVLMVKNDLPLYEYACHEGNYGMPNSLSAARYQEKTAAEAAKKGSN